MNSIKVIKKVFWVSLLAVMPSMRVMAQEITVATLNAEFLTKPRVHVKFGRQFDLNKESKKEQRFWNKESKRAEKFEEASASVAQVIKRINADILTLTEVGSSEDINILLNELKKIDVVYDYAEVCDCKDNFTAQHVAVLSKFPLKDPLYEIEGRSIYLEELDGDSERETGLSKALKATVIVEDKEIDVFVVHLKSERGGFESDAQRLAQASIVRRAVIKQLNKGRKVIVTGDLNSEKGSPSLYRIRGFDDIYEELIQTGLSQYFEDTEVRWTYNYKGEPEQIDHILISPGLTTQSGIKTSIIDISDEMVSDHNPVITKLNLK